MGHLLCLRGAGRPVGAPKGARRLSWKRFQMLEKSYTLPWCLQGAALPLADHRRAEAPRRGDEAASGSPPQGSACTWSTAYTDDVSMSVAIFSFSFTYSPFS